jgi:hypothetical protein
MQNRGKVSCVAPGIADLIEGKSPKLLAQAGQVLNQIVSEALCDEPQKKLMQALLGLGAVPLRRYA